MTQQLFIQKSGHFGHEGRKGKVGGSLPRDASGRGKELSIRSMRDQVEGTDGMRGRDFSRTVGEKLGKKWKPSNETLEEWAKQEGWTSSNKEDSVGSLLAQWTGSSGGDLAQVMFKHVGEEQGLDMSTVEPAPWFDEHPELTTDMQSLGDLIYGDTQDYLKSIDAKSVRLYRADLTGKPTRSFSSWSTSPGLFITTDPGRKMYMADIPANQIFSLSSTGFGNIEEGEVVVIGPVKLSPFTNESRVAIFHSGGPGSGHHGHSGRPGEVGGSQDDGESSGEHEKEFISRYPYMYHITEKKNTAEIANGKLKRSESGYGGKGVYFARTMEETQYYLEVNDPNARVFRVRSEDILNSYPFITSGGKTEYDEGTGEIIFKVDIPGNMLEWQDSQGSWRRGVRTK